MHYIIQQKRFNAQNGHTRGQILGEGDRGRTQMFLKMLIIGMSVCDTLFKIEGMISYEWPDNCAYMIMRFISISVGFKLEPCATVYVHSGCFFSPREHFHIIYLLYYNIFMGNYVYHYNHY